LYGIFSLGLLAVLLTRPFEDCKYEYESYDEFLPYIFCIIPVPSKSLGSFKIYVTLMGGEGQRFVTLHAWLHVQFSHEIYFVEERSKMAILSIT